MVKIAAASFPQLLLNLMNSLLEHQTFPDVWKTSEVVLIPKPGKPTSCPSSSRLIFLLDTTSKLLEHLILAILTREMEEKEVLSTSQYGFRTKRSTMDATNRILDLVAKARSKSTRRKRKWCALVTLDVKNAVNTATWETIITRLKEKNFSKYLINFISSYLHNRSINIYDTTFKTSAGVSQKSVLGSHLWNIFYDEMFRFVDDFSFVVIADCHTKKYSQGIPTKSQ